jgi:radical SAM-linked protein
MRTFIRALRRAGVPVAYSKGFNPQPKLSFAAPLGVGLEGKNEYLDLYLSEHREENKLMESFNEQFPPGLKIKKISTVELNQHPLASVIGAALYVANLPAVPPDLPQTLAGILHMDTLVKVRQDKKNVKKVDLRPFIYDLKIKDVDGKDTLFMLLATGSKGGVRPQEVLELLHLERDTEIKVYRQDLFILEGGTLKNPEGICSVYYL